MRTNILFLWFAIIAFLLPGTGCKKNTPPVAIPLIPKITAISPASGPAGAQVTITGAYFSATPADNTVKFNGVAATVQTATANSLTVLAPATGTTGNVTVATADGASNGILYTYLVAADIYIAGTDVSAGEGYWKNSVFNKVADCLEAKAIAGSGDDIYLAGPCTSQSPTYWKNGIAVTLDNGTGFVNAIFIAGKDVYTTGVISNLPSSPYSALKYWKNGTEYALTAVNSGYVYGIFVAGSDVYVAGYQPAAYWKACYWKNGSAVDLTDGTASNARATAIYVSGSDVYVAGIEEEKAGIGIVNQAPRLWKNGVSVPLTTPANSLFNDINSLLVTGSDVYVGGQYNGAGAVWKNGALINMAGYAVSERVGSMILHDNDLYATGSASSSGLNGYWKNGDFKQMSPGCGTAGPGCAATSSIRTAGIYIK